MKTPDEEVGESIVAEFKSQGLLSDAALEKIRPKLVAGSLSSSDWKLIFETERPKVTAKEGSK
jgi:hypothetical protein